ncbi:hypothetical protein IEQ34_020796 [Dendrobium chrysotoxum]|uniref:Uncharacterized protein n=1 Tax=Dendrobium chrysotoxum TaxID=161865 RepID=A0AAV7FKR6_DENCH|nr:hypothetical protein IEQ34_020796 [Dendrobium chrysotoxum]
MWINEYVSLDVCQAYRDINEGAPPYDQIFDQVYQIVGPYLGRNLGWVQVQEQVQDITDNMTKSNILLPLHTRMANISKIAWPQHLFFFLGANDTVIFAKGITRNCGGIRMPSIWECFICLSAHPDSQHQLSLNLITVLIFQSVPLRSQRAVRRNPFWNLTQIESNPPNKIILHKVLILDYNIKIGSLDPILREGKNLVPFRISLLLKMSCSSLVITKLNFHIRIKTARNILCRKVFSFDNTNIEILHLLNKVIGAGKLIPSNSTATEVRRSLLQGIIFRAKRPLHHLVLSRKHESSKSGDI